MKKKKIPYMVFDYTTRTEYYNVGYNSTDAKNTAMKENDIPKTHKLGAWSIAYLDRTATK